MLEKYQYYIVGAILAVMFLVSVFVSRGDAAIMDEVAHIPAGYSYVHFQDYRLNPEHPPLLKDLAGIPLQFLGQYFPTDEDFWTTDANGQWNAGWRFMYWPTNNTEAIVFWSRLPIILIALVLGFAIFQWAKELFGVKAGLLALALYAFDPNILGHGHYVTTDLGIAAFCLFAFYFFIRYLKIPGWKNIVLAGIFLGLAALAKFSSVLLFPAFGLALFFYALARKEKLPFSFLGSGKFKKFWAQKLWFYIATFVVILAIHGILIGLVYEFNTFRMPTEKIHQLIDTQLGGNTKQLVSPYLHSMANNAILKPYVQYLIGFFMVFGRVAGGNTTYFFGQVTNQSFRSYFPMVFLIKETLPFLILLFLSTAVGITMILKNNLPKFPKKIWPNIKNYLDKHIAEFSMISFVAVYAYVSITGNLNIGFRHLFPILPFLYILVAKEVTIFGRRIEGKKTGVKVYWSAIMLLLVWLAAETAFTYPNYLAYFNETVGGPKNGYKYVTDSNCDWGQDLKRLTAWVNDNNINQIRIDYFGGGDVIHYLGDKATIWHADMGQEPGWYAISATFLENSLYYKITEGTPDYEWLRERTPTAQIGGSILIYHVE
ncbi:MAG: glycosyltransferase family 39 protein [Candidatus Moranbacteria bacterium]|nr:glycosyltransferase family 39 protein [Candidatus Moranbacteria bacterium]